MSYVYVNGAGKPQIAPARLGAADDTSVPAYLGGGKNVGLADIIALALVAYGVWWLFIDEPKIKTGSGKKMSLRKALEADKKNLEANIARYQGWVDLPVDEYNEATRDLAYEDPLSAEAVAEDKKFYREQIAEDKAVLAKTIAELAKERPTVRPMSMG